MKKRRAFVSNSSSSSFVAVGVTDEDLVEQLRLAENPEDLEPAHGIAAGRVIRYYGSPAWLAGIDIEGLLKDDVPLSQIKCYFQKLLQKEMGVTVDVSMIDLHYGEASDM